jgi:multidrug transporter EmrE-like cation transporter
MLLAYSTAKLAPLTVYQPILMVSEAVLPSLIGLYVFHENKSLTQREKIAFVIGIAGVIIIGLSY